MADREERIKLLKALAQHYKTDVMTGKGGFFVKGEGFVTIAKARKVTGIEGPKREPARVQSAWGDYATIVMLNQPRSKRITPKTPRLRR